MKALKFTAYWSAGANNLRFTEQATAWALIRGLTPAPTNGEQFIVTIERVKVPRRHTQRKPKATR